VTEALRVLVADDSADFREGIRALLSSVDGLELVGEAVDGDAAVAGALDVQPDVVLMDLHMPGRNGIEATRAIVSAAPHIAVLVLTMHEDDESVFSAVRAGARGYLVKGASQDEVVRAISTVHAGGLVFGASLALRIADLLSGTTTPDRSAFPQLTERELEILDLIAAGKNNTQIASSLYLAPKTVRNNVSTILAKLQATDRAEAIIRARDAGLGGGSV
jgi:DNA-binding NarL/FixJ family response regulator